MYNRLTGIAAGAILAAALAGPTSANAADQRQSQDVVPIVGGQNAAEEFTAQRRRIRRSRVVVRRSVASPRRFVSRRYGYWRAPVRRYAYRRWGPGVSVSLGGPAWYGGYWGGPYAYAPSYAYVPGPYYGAWGAPYPRRFYRNYWGAGPYVSVSPWGFSFGVW